MLSIIVPKIVVRLLLNATIVHLPHNVLLKRTINKNAPQKGAFVLTRNFKIGHSP